VPSLTFVTSPGGRRTVEVERGVTVLEAARRAGLPVASSCRGVGVCDACRVRVIAGDEGLGPRTPAEEKRQLGPDERMACQAVVDGPATLTASYW
jgi:ferredoxin